MPRSDTNYADGKTDIYALGSAIYGIIIGSEPFPEVDPLNNSRKTERATRCKSGRLPHLETDFGGDIIHTYWARGYESASELDGDLRKRIGVTQNGMTLPQRCYSSQSLKVTCIQFKQSADLKGFMVVSWTQQHLLFTNQAEQKTLLKLCYMSTRIQEDYGEFYKLRVS